MRWGVTSEWTVGMNMTQRGFKAGGTLVKVTVNADMSEFPALKAGFIIVEVVTGKGCVMVTTCPSNLSAGKGVMFLLGQGRWEDGGSGTFGSSSSFLSYGFGGG